MQGCRGRWRSLFAQVSVGPTFVATSPAISFLTPQTRPNKERQQWKPSEDRGKLLVLVGLGFSHEARLTKCRYGLWQFRAHGSLAHFFDSFSPNFEFEGFAQRAMKNNSKLVQYSSIHTIRQSNATVV